MRGRKVDIDFISEFITDCAANNKTSPQEIYTEAKRQLKLVNRKLKAIELLKIRKAQLEDVMSSIEKT